ncbi:glycosyltransferase family 39 protein [Terriglobus roseus]|nr:glycosyltransferase family 39 protein [Terriglobus roseus]
MSFRFHFGLPQKIAALILLLFFAATLFVIGRTPLTESDYRYALCGREMWEKPAPAAGYFTTCGNMQGDGTLAYRAAALPLSIYVNTLRLEDWIAAKRNHTPADSDPVGGSVYDLRHQIVGTRYLLRVPFALAAVMLGAGLWWVTRRLFGNVGGAMSLLLYCVSPLVLRYATTPNNEILAAWGLYAVIYTAIGIAHAMYGPPRKWRPRIVLFTLALGLTACAHLLAAVLGLFASAVFMLYVAERRRTLVFPVLLVSAFGALMLVFASYTFRLGLFTYVFTGGAGRFTLDYMPALELVRDPLQLAVTAAAGIALVLFVLLRRARYFGNTVPLLVTLVLLPIETTQISSIPVVWAYPFLLTFVGGAFADAAETKQRKLFLAIVLTTLLAQGILCGTWLWVSVR